MTTTPLARRCGCDSGRRDCRPGRQLLDHVCGGTPYSSAGPSFTCLGLLGETLTCGQLSIVNLEPCPSPTRNHRYHRRLSRPHGHGSNGQLFIGATRARDHPATAAATGARRAVPFIYNTLTTAVAATRGWRRHSSRKWRRDRHPAPHQRGAGIAQQSGVCGPGQGSHGRNALHLRTTIDAWEYNRTIFITPASRQLGRHFYDVKMSILGKLRSARRVPPV